MLFSIFTVFRNTSPSNPRLLAPNPRRRTIMIFPPFTGTAFISPILADAQNSDGIQLTKSQSPVILKASEIGDLITGDWFCIISSSASITVIEGLE